MSFFWVYPIEFIEFLANSFMSHTFFRFSRLKAFLECHFFGNISYGRLMACPLSCPQKSFLHLAALCSFFIILFNWHSFSYSVKGTSFLSEVFTNHRLHISLTHVHTLFTLTLPFLPPALCFMALLLLPWLTIEEWFNQGECPFSNPLLPSSSSSFCSWP